MKGRHQIDAMERDGDGCWIVTCSCGWVGGGDGWETRQQTRAARWFAEHVVEMEDVETPSLDGMLP